VLRSVSIALFVILATARASAQQTSIPQPPPQDSSQQAAPPRDRVKVYAPRSGVKPAKLIAMDPLPQRVKKCWNDREGEVVLSLIVDTKGMARNIMFQSVDGSDLDRFAISVASLDRFQPGTLDGKPVVVAESLRIYLETCIVMTGDPSGKIGARQVLKSPPLQHIEKPKNPPEEVVFAPTEVPDSELVRKVSRPDYFGTSKSAPVLLYSANAQYTPAHAGKPIRGICKISLVVDPYGIPENPRVLKSLDPGLDVSALAAVNDYRFFPAIEDEEPVSAAVVVDVNFAPPSFDLYSPDID
jgi:TonB family protein